MSIDVLAVGTHGHLRSTGDILLLSVGSWGKFPKLGPTEFIVGIQQVSLSSFIAVTFDIESHVFRVHDIKSEIPSGFDVEAFVAASRSFVSAMLPPQLESHIRILFKRLSRISVFGGESTISNVADGDSQVSRTGESKSKVGGTVKEDSDVT